MTNKKDEPKGAPSRGMPEPRAGAQMPGAAKPGDAKSASTPSSDSVAADMPMPAMGVRRRDRRRDADARHGRAVSHRQWHAERRDERAGSGRQDAHRRDGRRRWPGSGPAALRSDADDANGHARGGVGTGRSRSSVQGRRRPDGRLGGCDTRCRSRANAAEPRGRRPDGLQPHRPGARPRARGTNAQHARRGSGDGADGRAPARHGYPEPRKLRHAAFPRRFGHRTDRARARTAARGRAGRAGAESHSAADTAQRAARRHLRSGGRGPGDGPAEPVVHLPLPRQSRVEHVHGRQRRRRRHRLGLSRHASGPRVAAGPDAGVQCLRRRHERVVRGEHRSRHRGHGARRRRGQQPRHGRDRVGRVAVADPGKRRSRAVARRQCVGARHRLGSDDQQWRPAQGDHPGGANRHLRQLRAGAVGERRHPDGDRGGRRGLRRGRERES